MADVKDNNSSGVLTKERVKVKEPSTYKVLLLNDDYSTMDFVISVLENIFDKGPAEATRIMLAVHHQGRGLCGIYTKQIAEAKVDQVHKRAKNEGHPLKCIMEKNE
jgi:ATP-dependent Clp protease adaptor protein ClpS